MEIRLFTEQDAQALWDLRMLALETDPWSFVDSPEELRAISVEELASAYALTMPKTSLSARSNGTTLSEWSAVIKKCP